MARATRRTQRTRARTKAGRAAADAAVAAELVSILQDLRGKIALLRSRLDVAPPRPSLATHLSRYGAHYAVAGVWLLIVLLVSPIGRAPVAGAGSEPEAARQTRARPAAATVNPPVEARADDGVSADEGVVFSAVAAPAADATSPAPVSGGPAVPPAGQTTPDPDAPTAVEFVFAGAMSVAPGLCLPGGPFSPCQNPPEAAFRITLTSCTAAGTFEGATLAPGSDCGGTLTGVLRSAAGALAPSCAGFSMLTSEGSALRFAGLERALALSAPASAGSLAPSTGSLDGADADDSPVGDHDVAGSIDIRPVTTGDGAACVTVPASSFEVAGVLTIG